MADYLERLVDHELQELLPELPAIALEGPKGVGKTETCLRHARTTFSFDDRIQRELFGADPQRVDRAAPTVFVDEWQREPEVWDVVRRSVDRDPTGGRFLLAGSATPTEAPTHSGAGRIVRLRMRPLSLAERYPDPPKISLAGLLSGARAPIVGETQHELADYVEDIVSSGFPAIRPLRTRTRGLQLDGYLERLSEHDFADQGHLVRRPATLQRWLTAYAAATGTTASYNAILDAATPGESDKPSKPTTIAYRNILQQLWLIDDVPAWAPPGQEFSRLAQAPKHHLADPALAAHLLNANHSGLMEGVSSSADSFTATSLLGRLFESLVTISVKTYAQANDAKVFHLRERSGKREVDLIIQGPDGRIVALEIKLARSVADSDTKNLHWLGEQLGPKLADSAMITTGPYAYRRTDGIAVVPAAMLGA